MMCIYQMIMNISLGNLKIHFFLHADRQESWRKNKVHNLIIATFFIFYAALMAFL